ncbi:penicillin-binding protein 2 [Candidatus Dojkabacteria bacterium]|nr:penicillin-binding protein 2 [Candidatus Dojkabacteria bacterium]
MTRHIIETITDDKQVAPSSWRLLFIMITLILMMGFLLTNLFDLQIVSGKENLIRATNISQNKNILRASRGVIYDENGEILAKNIPAFSVYIKTKEFDLEDENKLNLLSTILEIDKEDIVGIVEVAIEDERKPVVTIDADISFEKYISLTERLDELYGVYTEETAIRQYGQNTGMAHILGYVGDINEGEIEQTGLDQNAKIGKEGIEKQYDQALRGTDGTEVKKTDLEDKILEEYISASPQEGSNLYLTIDSNWQKKLYEILEKQVDVTDSFAGVAVIMESRTGEIKAMANVPSYDNNLFTEGISVKDFTALMNDERTPLLNRSIALQLPTGSTFKPMVAAAALEEGAITPSTQFQSGCVELPLYKLCEADNAYLGTMTVVEGLGRSSNVFFCKTALALTEKADGIRSLIKYTDQFGIGKKTGIDLPGEQAGTMASPELKEEKVGEPWYLADICNTAIGQGLVTATPIQMVTMVSAIANEGVIYKPHLVSKITDQTGKEVEIIAPEVLSEVSVSKENFRTIRKGMKYAVNGYRGSATALKNSPGNPYAKTGSADATEYRNGKKVDGAHSWAIGGFEYEGKDYSFVIHLQEGGRGYKSMPVIRDFLSWLYR